MTKIIATMSLPMHDWLEIREATDMFAAGLAQQLGIAPEMQRGGDYHQPWHDPNLGFSQTCGYPLTHELRGKVKYVATPHYEADGCDGPNYCSIIYAREHRLLQDFKSKRAVINNPDSMSGMLALKIMFSEMAVSGKFFAETKQSGSHIASLQMVANGDADVCAVDCVTAALAKQHRPELFEGLVEVGRSPKVPGLPFITNQIRVAKVEAALLQVFQDETLNAARHTMLIKGYSVLKIEDYDVILELENRHQMML